MHSILYKFKTHGKEMIQEANFRERILIMQAAEEAKSEGDNVEYTKQMKMYDEKLKAEEQNANEFV